MAKSIYKVEPSQKGTKGEGRKEREEREGCGRPNIRILQSE